MTCRPDIVIMNTTLVDADALEVLQQIKRLQPDLPVILLHPEPDMDLATLALARGASGVFTKLDYPETQIEAVEVAVHGGTYGSAASKALANGSNHTE